MDDSAAAVDVLVKHVRALYKGQNEQRAALMRRMATSPEVRQAIAQYLLERGDCVRVPMVGNVG